MEFQDIAGRVFLDTCVVNLILDYGEQIHENLPIPDRCNRRVARDIDSLVGIFATGQRASWQLAISPLTYREVSATRKPARAVALATWFNELWDYWGNYLDTSPDIPSFSEAAELRLQLLTSGILGILPDAADRILICDAVAYRCDALCTRDWSTILQFRDQLHELPLRILTPSEWWSEIRPWAGIWC